MANQVCYSTNDEDYDCDDLDAVLDRLFNEGRLSVGQVYYEMDCEPITAASFANASNVDRLLDGWAEQLFDMVDEADENDFQVNADAVNELKALLSGWIDKHVSLNRYWRVTGKRRERTVTQEDIDNG